MILCRIENLISQAFDKLYGNMIILISVETYLREDISTCLNLIHLLDRIYDIEIFHLNQLVYLG